MGEKVGEITEREKEGGLKYVKATQKLAGQNIKQAWARSVD